MLDCTELQPFEQTLRRVLFLAFEAGQAYLERTGYRVPDIKVDHRAMSRFIRACHKGYDKAQQAIGALVIDYEHDVRARELEIKDLRRRRDITSVRRVLNYCATLRRRQLVLRRVVDALLYLIVSPETWVLRRFTVTPGISRIDPNVLKRTLEVASRRNAASRYLFSIVADLTTAVQVGDLIQVDMTPPGPKRWTIIELKEGRMNEMLSGLLDESSRSGSMIELEDIEQKFGDAALKQMRRMTRQRGRMDEFKKIVTTDKGVDLLHKVGIQLTPDVVFVEDYLPVVGELVDRAIKKGLAGRTVDTCLHLVAVRDRILIEHGTGAVAHTFFHMVDREVPCRLDDTTDRLKEIEAFATMPPFFDLIWHNLNLQWGLPFFLWPLGSTTLHQRIVDLAMERIRIFAQFDMNAFFKLAAADGIKMSWIVGKDAQELKKLSERLPGSPNAWGVRAVLSDGTKQSLLSGFFARLFGELATPRQLLEMIKRGPEQAAKMRPESEQSSDS